VRKHGIALAPELFPVVGMLPRSEAEKLEVSHAEGLREQGYAVWQR
jgi:hypothetical protein